MTKLPPSVRVMQTMGTCIFIVGVFNYLTGLPVFPRMDQVTFLLAVVALMRIERGGDRGQ